VAQRDIKCQELDVRSVICHRISYNIIHKLVLKNKHLQLHFALTLFSLFGFVQITPGQTIKDSVFFDHNLSEIKGLVLDAENQKPLPYTNIYVLHKHKGVVSNETGRFSIDVSDLGKTDTLRFQYIGYKTRNLTIEQLDTLSIVYLKEEIFNLSEILVFGSDPDPLEIVKKVLENRAANYKKSNCKQHIFMRERDMQDMNRFNIKYKKSTIDELDRDMIALVEDKFPDNFTSFTDYMGKLYLSNNPDDSIKFKVDPIRTVSLKEKDLADLEQLEEIFKNVFENTGEEEYWKVRSGIFGDKIDLEEDTARAKRDTLKENERRVSSFKWRVRSRLRYSSLDDKDDWEFLHKTGKYNYTLAGGTRVNGEDVYIIDFIPKSGGHYIGRMFIATNTYALIRADYEYAEGKTGTNIQILGIGYTETQYSGSIYFERKDSTYRLKYFSYKEAANASIDRSVVLKKKRKRFLFDKTLKELKVGIYLSMTMNESVEYLVLDEKEISGDEYAGFKQPKVMEVIMVDQFDDKLWQGFSIIEPTQQMKEYKKQEVNFKD